MAKKKNDSEENVNEENQEFNDIDENFGLPDLEHKPADEVEEEGDSSDVTDEPQEEPQEREPHVYSWDREEETEEAETSDTDAGLEVETETEPETEESGDSYAEQVDDQEVKSESEYVPGTYTQKMNDSSEGGGKTTGIIVAVIVVLAIIAGGYYWFVMKPDQDAKEKAKQEQLAKEASDKKKKEDFDKLIVKGDGEFGEESWNEAESSYSQATALYPEEQYAKDQLAIVRDKLDEIAAENAKPAVGEIETISERTQRYHVIVSSSIDGDLAMDYAKKISTNGEYVGIISPYGENKYYRLTLGSYDTWQDAEGAISSFNSSYGDGIWILKY